MQHSELCFNGGFLLTQRDLVESGVVSLFLPQK